MTHIHQCCQKMDLNLMLLSIRHLPHFYKNLLPLAVSVTRKSYLGQHWSNHQCRAPHKLIINTVSVDILWKSEKWENSNLIYFFQKSIYN